MGDLTTTGSDVMWRSADPEGNGFISGDGFVYPPLEDLGLLSDPAKKLPEQKLLDQPGYAREAASLLLIVAREVALEKTIAFSSFWNRIQSLGPGESEAWNQWADQITQRLDHGPLDYQAIHQLIEASPPRARTPLIQLKNLFEEDDPARFFRGALGLGRRYLSDHRYHSLAHSLLNIAKKDSNLKGEANGLLRFQRGEGSFSQTLDFGVTPFLKEMLSPLSLASFGMAAWAGRRAAAQILGRATHYTPWAVATSEAAALAAEVPALVLSRRVGQYFFLGGENLFSPEEIAQELLLTYGPFAFLRMGSNAFQGMIPAIRRIHGIEGVEGELTRGGSRILATSRFSFELGAVLLGQGFNGLWGLGGLPGHDGNIFWTSLQTVVHMRVAGKILDSIHGFGSATHRLIQNKQRLIENSVEKLLARGKIRPDHPLHERFQGEVFSALRQQRMGPLTLNRWSKMSQRGENFQVTSQMEAVGLPLLAKAWERLPNPGVNEPPSELPQAVWGRQWSLVGNVVPMKKFHPEGLVFTERHDGEGGGRETHGGSKKIEGLSSFPPEQRWKVLVRRARDKMAEYRVYLTQAASEQKEDNALIATYRLWERFIRDRGEPKEENFTEQLQETQGQLEQAQESVSRTAQAMEWVKTYLQRAQRERDAAKDPGSTPLPNRTHQTPPPKETLASRFIIDPALRLFVAGRDSVVVPLVKRILKKSESPNPPEGTSKLSQTPEGPEMAELREMEQDVERHEPGERAVGEMIDQANLLTRLIHEAKDRGLSESLRGQMDSVVDRLNGLFEGKEGFWWNKLGTKEAEHNVNNGKKLDRRYGNISGLGIHEELFPPGEDINIPLEMMHLAIKKATYSKGDVSQLRQEINQAMEWQSELSERSQEGIRLTGEGLFQMIHGQYTPETLVGELKKSVKPGPLAKGLQTLMDLKEAEVSVTDGLTQLKKGMDVETEAGNYLTSGIWVFLSSQGNPDSLTRLVREASGMKDTHFHPSIPVSFFGAAYGAKRLPKELFDPNFDPEMFYQQQLFLTGRGNLHD